MVRFGDILGANDAEIVDIAAMLKHPHAPISLLGRIAVEPIDAMRIQVTGDI